MGAYEAGLATLGFWNPPRLDESLKLAEAAAIPPLNFSSLPHSSSSTSLANSKLEEVMKL